MEKILPTKFPIVTTYTQHAHLLSILSNYEYTYPWIFSNYIQIFINKDFKHNWADFYFPASYELRPSDTCKWLTSQKLHRDMIPAHWDSFIDFIVESINSNLYVHTMLNYFYVQPSPAYAREHMCHDIFIYGYNMEKAIFYVSDFFKNGKYSNETLSFSDCSKAFSTYNRANSPAYLNEMIYLYRINEDYKDKYAFDVNAVLNSIKLYLASSIPEYWGIYNFESDGKNLDFGTEIYTSLNNYLKNIMTTGEIVDLRPFFLLYDHKRIMLLRLKYLHDQGYVEKIDNQIITQFSNVVTQAEIVLNKLLKYNITKNHGSFEKIMIRLNGIRKDEFNILNAFL